MASQRTALMFPLWLLCVTNAVQAATSGSICPAPDRQPPVYPQALMKHGVGGVTVLVLSLDRCGHVTEASIEKSSGYDELDAAAVSAARNWTLGPQPIDRKTRQPERVRVPVNFTIDESPQDIPDYALPSDRPRDAHFMARRQMRLQAPPAMPDGKLPGYVADTFPIGVATVAEAVAMLEKYGRRQPTLVEGVDEYFLGDTEGFSRWTVLSAGFKFAPSVYRMRLVADGRNGFFATSALCGAAEREDCAGLDRYLRSQPPQTAMPAPPMLPKLIPSSAARHTISVPNQFKKP